MKARSRPETATHLWCCACKCMQPRAEFCCDVRTPGGIAYACRQARGVRTKRFRERQHTRERLKTTLYYHLLTADELQDRLEFWTFVKANAVNPTAVILARHQAKRAADWLFLHICRAEWARGRQAPSIASELPIEELAEAA